jgi:hypothetical protein
VAGKTKPIKYKVNDVGCFIVVSHKGNSKGYPEICHNYKRQVMSRFIYEQCFGEILNGLFVLHKCDTPRCINPEHLFLGTQKDNMQDRDKKGRHAKIRGESHSQSKLTEKEVSEIKTSKLSQRKLAKIYNIDPSYVCRIKQGKAWGWLP